MSKTLQRHRTKLNKKSVISQLQTTCNSNE